MSKQLIFRSLGFCRLGPNPRRTLSRWAALSCVATVAVAISAAVLGSPAAMASPMLAMSPVMSASSGSMSARNARHEAHPRLLKTSVPHLTHFAPPGAAVATSAQYGVPDQTDVFVVGSNGTLYVFWVGSAGTWLHHPISPARFAPPGARLAASAQYGVPDQTDVFVVGSNGTLYVFWVGSALTWLHHPI